MAGDRGQPDAGVTTYPAAARPAYPAAERVPVLDELHGHAIPDPYRWLEDAASAPTAAWLAAQDELWRRYAVSLPGRDVLAGSVAALSGRGLVTAPMWRGDRRFVLRRDAGRQRPVLYVAGPDGAERVLVDPMALDPGGTTNLDHWLPDPSGRLLAYQISRRGDERSELSVVDVDSGRPVDGPIDRCRYSPVAWLPDGGAFFYVRHEPGDPAGRRVYLHRVGTPADDALVFGADRSGPVTYGLAISEDGRWLVVSATTPAARGNELWLGDLAPAGPAHPDLRLVHGAPTARSVPHVGRDGRLYVLTDLDAPTGRLCVGDPRHPGPDGWRDLLPADPDAVLGDFVILDGPRLHRPVLLVGRIRHAIGELAVHDLATGERLAEVPLPGHGAIGPLATRPGGGHEAWFTYTDSVTPPEVWHHDAAAGITTRWAAAPGGDPWPATPPEIASTRLVCTSKDGTPVRVVVLAPAARTGPLPTILYGYGGFGQSLIPSYSSFALAWVRAGGAFATAHVRGGGEAGEQWHRAGTLDRKQNTFDDFAAAAERLVADGWTTPARLGLCGESNGGLLVGAMLTQRPELFAAAVCSAPLLDMVRYEYSGLGPSWRGEYGSASDPEQLGWLLGYSPYHRVRHGVDYPAVLFTVFGGDTRVDPMHARKMCAALQWATAGRRPVLLRHETDVGHGARATDRAVALAADMLAFLAAHTGLDLTAGDRSPAVARS